MTLVINKIILDIFGTYKRPLPQLDSQGITTYDKFDGAGVRTFRN